MLLVGIVWLRNRETFHQTELEQKEYFSFFFCFVYDTKEKLQENQETI
jgi:hypothetical protein